MIWLPAERQLSGAKNLQATVAKWPIVSSEQVRRSYQPCRKLLYGIICQYIVELPEVSNHAYEECSSH